MSGTELFPSDLNDLTLFEATIVNVESIQNVVGDGLLDSFFQTDFSSQSIMHYAFYLEAFSNTNGTFSIDFVKSTNEAIRIYPVKLAASVDYQPFNFIYYPTEVFTGVRVRYTSASTPIYFRNMSLKATTCCLTNVDMVTASPDGGTTQEQILVTDLVPGFHTIYDPVSSTYRGLVDNIVIDPLNPVGSPGTIFNFMTPRGEEDPYYVPILDSAGYLTINMTTAPAFDVPEWLAINPV
jgi:hypothetical protein